MPVSVEVEAAITNLCRFGARKRHRSRGRDIEAHVIQNAWE